MNEYKAAFVPYGYEKRASVRHGKNYLVEKCRSDCLYYQYYHTYTEASMQGSSLKDWDGIFHCSHDKTKNHGDDLHDKEFDDNCDKNCNLG
jgi:hypothetical protein